MLDKEFTKAISVWLSTSREERDVVAGAELLLRLTGNRQFYATACVRPDVVHDHVEYELKKHLSIREAGHNTETLRALERGLLSELSTMEESAVVSVADESTEDDAYVERAAGEAEHVVRRGRRADHDELPEYIQQIVEDNSVRYEQMRVLYNRLLSMQDAAPCDRKEDIFQLDKLHKEWGAAWKVYDHYGTAEALADEQDDEDAASADDGVVMDGLTLSKKVSAAKRYLQKHKKKLSELQEIENPDASVLASITDEESKIEEKSAELSALLKLNTVENE